MGKLKHSVLVLGEGPTEFFVGMLPTNLLLADAVVWISETLLLRINHVSTSYHPPFKQISFTYRFRIVSASVSENDRRTIGGRYENNTRTIRDRYEIDTRSIRERYEIDRVRLLTDALCKKFNFCIVMCLDYILHYGCLLCSTFHTAMADASLAKTQQLYKDNSAPCRMQVD